MEIPKTFLKKFEPQDINFEVDVFDEMLLQDAFMNDEDSKIRLSRDVTKQFNSWINQKLSKKENISLNIKGSTRGGKSLVGLKLSGNILDFYGKDFASKIDYIVCANQKEYRQNLQTAEFGDVFQIDENTLTNAGVGANLEMSQLKDIQNIIAKKNIHTIYITPKTFLNNTSEIGISYLGKDTKNWLSKFLLYSLKGSSFNSTLLGYIIIDVGAIFRKYGCFLYKEMGGCTNPKQLTFEELDKENIKYSYCISKDYDKTKLKTDKTVCPFYDVCAHPLNKYEHKKDKWIDREMKGGLDERSKERFTIALKLVAKLGTFSEEKQLIKFDASNQKDLKNKVRLKIHRITSTKLGVMEFEELIEMMKSLTKVETLSETLIQLENEELEKELFSIEGGFFIEEYYKKYKEENKDLNS